MESIHLNSQVGEDGILRLETPIGIRNQKVEVILVIHPQSKKEEQQHEGGGWPLRFFDEVVGSLPDFPEIDSEGDFEEREALE